VSFTLVLRSVNGPPIGHPGHAGFVAYFVACVIGVRDQGCQKAGAHLLTFLFYFGVRAFCSVGR